MIYAVSDRSLVYVKQNVCLSEGGKGGEDMYLNSPTLQPHHPVSLVQGANASMIYLSQQVRIRYMHLRYMTPNLSIKCRKEAVVSRHKVVQPACRSRACTIFSLMFPPSTLTGALKDVCCMVSRDTEEIFRYRSCNRLCL